MLKQKVHKAYIDPAKIPYPGVRIDDLNCARLARAYKPKDLGRMYPSEFDQAGIIRARRFPVGDAAKAWYEEGELDFLGEPAPKSAFYYVVAIRTSNFVRGGRERWLSHKAF